MARREFGARELGVGGGTLFGLFMGVYSYLDSGRVWLAIVAGVLGGALFGLFMGRWVGRQRRRAVAALGSTRPTSRPADLKRAVKDPASADPGIRAEALRIAEFQLAEFERTRKRTLLIFVVAVVLEIVLAMTSTPWFWLAAGFFAAMLILTVVSGARLQHTVERLRAADSRA